jgi:hypothetical protein
MSSLQILIRSRSRPTTWLPEAGPRTLAALRVVVGGFGFHIGRGFLGFEALPQELWSPPRGTAWLDFLPVSDVFISISAVLLVSSSLLLALGWRPKWTATAAAVAFFYLGWVTTLSGKVDHSHHLLWVLVVLAVSPCANVWAIRPEDRRGSYRWAVFAVMTMVGLVYFGAGVPKLFSAGLAWGWSENLTNTMLNQAWEKGNQISWWLVDMPVLGRLLGTAGLLFELTFLPLVLIPRTRRWVWPAGLMFHWGTWLILGISFLTLQALYVVFLPWDRPGDRSPPTDVQRRVLIVLVASVAIFSVSGATQAWPLAAYPAFSDVADHYVNDYEVVTDGETMFLTDAPLPVPPWHAVILIENNLRLGRLEETIDWLGVDALYRVKINTLSGEVVERTRVG